MKKFYSLLFLTLFCASVANAMEERPTKKIKIEFSVLEDAATMIQKNWRGHKVRRDVSFGLVDEAVTKVAADFLLGRLDIGSVFEKFQKLPKTLKPYFYAKLAILVFKNMDSNLHIKEQFSPEFLRDLFAFATIFLGEDYPYFFRLLKDELFEGSKNRDLHLAVFNLINVKMCMDAHLLFERNRPSLYPQIRLYYFKKMIKKGEKICQACSSEILRCEIKDILLIFDNFVKGLDFLINQLPEGAALSQEALQGFLVGTVQPEIARYFDGKDFGLGEMGKNVIKGFLSGINQALMARLC